MKPVTLHGPGSEVVSTFLNLLQRSAVGAQAATGGDATLLTPTNGEFANELGAMRRGADVRHYQLTALVDGQLAIVDRSLDWRDRIIDAVVFVCGVGTNRLLGSAADTAFATLPGAVTERVVVNRYLGTGAFSNTATGASVATGAAPVNGVDVVRSYAVELTAGLWLYAAPGDGSLRVFNATGVGVDLLLRVTGYGQTAKRSTPLSDGSAPATSPAAGATGNAAYLQGVPISTTPPLAGQTLAFDGVEYAPVSGGGGGGVPASVLLRDGTRTMTGNLDLGANRIKDLGAPEDVADAVRLDTLTTALAGVASLDAANVFTELQTLSKGSGTWGNPIPVAAFRHDNGSGSAWQGVAVRFEVKNSGAPAIPYGYVVARAHGVGGDANDNFVEMRPAHAAGDPPVGLRVRCNVAGAVWGAELLLAASDGTPTLQPCRESGSGDVDLAITGLGAGVVRLPAATGFVGTVLEILALTRPIGVQAFAVNASGGPRPCWSTGTGWVFADGTPLS